MKNDIVEIVVSLILLVISAAGTATYSYASCDRWSGYGETSWGPINGCMVFYKGKWTPAQAIRETP